MQFSRSSVSAPGHCELFFSTLIHFRRVYTSETSDTKLAIDPVELRNAASRSGVTAMTEIVYYFINRVTLINIAPMQSADRKSIS